MLGVVIMVPPDLGAVAHLRPHFTVEPFSRWRRDAQPLFNAHWAEIARHRDQVPLNPDWARYQKLEDAGALLAVTMREGWRLVGYATFLVASHLHYLQIKVASQDMIYIAPEYRAGGFAYCELVRFCDAELEARGVNISLQRDKNAHALGPVYRRLHYTPVEQVHEKVLLPFGSSP